MPKEWWEIKFPTDLARLIETLDQRRSKIRDLITAFRNSTRNPLSQMGRQLAGPSSAIEHGRRLPGARVSTASIGPRQRKWLFPFSAGRCWGYFARATWR
jgi:hypothetical protein